MVNLPPKRQMANSPSKSATSCPLGKIMTDQQTNRQMDIRVYREVTLPIMIVVVGGMREERWTR